MTTALSTSAAANEKPNARTQAALERLCRAKQEIEADILANGGIYPFNYGRVTQSELCRRADVKKATLQNLVHKDTTRVEVINWLSALDSRLTKTRDSTRERVTAVADNLSAELAEVTRTLQDTQARLTSAEQVIELLQFENADLRNRLNIL
jgi:hypothetical protein